MPCGERYERWESEHRPQKVARWKSGHPAGLHCPYVYYCNSKCGWFFHVSGSEGPIESTAPSNSSIKTRISTEIPGRLFVGGYSSVESRLNTQIQCAILWTRRAKISRVAFLFVAITRVRVGTGSSGMRGRTSVSNSASSCPQPGGPDGEERRVAWRARLPGLPELV